MVFVYFLEKALVYEYRTELETWTGGCKEDTETAV